MKCRMYEVCVCDVPVVSVCGAESVWTEISSLNPEFSLLAASNLLSVFPSTFPPAKKKEYLLNFPEVFAYHRGREGGGEISEWEKKLKGK
jgi:hypothetical protein